MDVREKLIDLLTGHSIDTQQDVEYIADYLIRNSVTVQENVEISDELLKQLKNAPITICKEEPSIELVQEWISVKEQLPQENEPEGALCEDVQVLLNNGKVSVGWCNRRTKLWYHMDYGEDYFTSNDYDHTPVVAWMPLSEPPKGE